MNFLKEHGEKIVFVLVAALCVVMLYLTREVTRPEVLRVYGNRIAVEDALAKSKPSPNYLSKKLEYLDIDKLTEGRPLLPLPEAVPVNASYPAPSRPVIQDEPVTSIGPTEYANLNQLNDLKTRTENGVVFVTFAVPGGNKFMDLVRAEVYRGETEKIDLTKRYDEVVLGPEEPEEQAAAPKADETAKGPDAPSSGEIRRKAHEDAGGAAQTAAAKAAEMPADMAEVEVYADTHVEPKKKYFYQLRLVGRMTVADGEKIEDKDKAGNIIRIHEVHAPLDLQTVPPTDPDSQVKLYATAFTSVVSATAPSNFQIRLAGTEGDIPGPNTPLHIKEDAGYKGSFAIRVWLMDAQVWAYDQIRVSKGEPLIGRIIYKLPGSNERKEIAFDTGYKLVEINEVPQVIEKEVEETVLDAAGNPVMDKGLPVKEKVKKTVTLSPKVIATLEDVATGKQESFEKQGDWGMRDKYIKLMEAKAKAQADAKKKAGKRGATPAKKDAGRGSRTDDDKKPK